MINVRVWEDGPTKVCASMVLPLRIGGTITLLATIDSRAVVLAFAKRGVRFLPKGDGSHALTTTDGVELGSFFGSIGKALKKVAKVTALDKALSLGKALVNSPIGKLVAPGASAAIHAAAGAAKLVKAARGKDPVKAQKAKLALVAAKAQAKAETSAGRQLPLPSGVANRSAETRGSFRYLVTVAKVAA
jgi:hypothetical protein